MQQHEVISLQISAARTRLLIGSDNVYRWSEQRIWDAALKDVQIVVSTYAVLADTLSRGFMRMKKLALLVFDEGRLTMRYGHAFFLTFFSHMESSLLYTGISSKQNYTRVLSSHEARVGSSSSYSRTDGKPYHEVQTSRTTVGYYTSLVIMVNQT